MSGFASTWDSSATQATQILQSVREEKQAEQALRNDSDKKSFVNFLFKLRQAATTDTVFAEEFLANEGLDIVCSCLHSVQGGQQTELLRLVHVLLLFENAIDEFTDDTHMIDKIYNLLKRSNNISKQVMEVLIVTVGKTEVGQSLIHQSAMKVVKGDNPYAPLERLLHAQDLNVVSNVLTFLNVLMTRSKGKEPSIKELVSLWKKCGLLRALQPLNEIEDADIKNQLTVFQKLTGHTIPLGWYAAEQYELRAEELRKKLHDANLSLQSFQSTSNKAPLVFGELERVNQQMTEMKAMMTEIDRDRENPYAIELQQWDDHMQKYTKQVFTGITTSAEFKNIWSGLVQDAIGKQVKGFGKGTKDIDIFDGDSDMSSESYEGPSGRFRPPSEPDSDSTDSTSTSYDTDSSDGEPPPDTSSDDEPPPDDDEYGAVGGVGGAVGVGGVAPPVPGAAPGVPGAPPVAGAPPVPGAPGAAAAGGAPPPPGPGAPPAPPVPGARTGAPPPPGGGKKMQPKKPMGPKALKLTFFKGTVPKKKMRVMHWEKYDIYEGLTSMWHSVHSDLGGDLDCSFDAEEFETMFSQKENTNKKEGKPDKPEAVILIDPKKFQNISIMMHKMPTIPEIQRAVQQLDSSVLGRDQLEALLGQVPAEEDEKEFKLNADKKPEDQYEPPEQFFSMVINSIAFVKRCKSWMLTFDWDEIVQNAYKPIRNIQAACDSILNSVHLPFVMGIVLGFGNYMNEGNAQRGNAPGFAVSTLSKLEMTKNIEGKMNLLQYVVQVVHKTRQESLKLPEELKPCLEGAQGVKMSDLEEGLKNTGNALKNFKRNVKKVKDELAAAGISEEEDPFVRRMTEFYERAEKDANDVEAKVKKATETFIAVLEFWSVRVNPAKTPDPDEFFAHLCPFLTKFQTEAASILKEMRRQEKLGAKISKGKGGDMEAIAQSIKLDLVQS